MGALLVAGALGLGFLAFRRKPKKSKRLPPEAPRPPKPVPKIVWEMEEWFIPENWLEDYATPEVQEIVYELHEQEEEIDPAEVTWMILQKQTGGFTLPPAPHPPEGEFWQTDVPNAPNYYQGPESVLGLFYHVNAYVEEALGRWAAGDEIYLVDYGLDEEAA